MPDKLKRNLNKEFLDYYLSSSLPSMKVGLIFTCILFFFFAFVNLTFFPDFPSQKYFMRFGIVAPFMVFSIVVIYLKPLRKNLHLAFVLINLLITAGIFLVGIASSPTQPGYEYFYAWVMLVIIGLHTFFRLEFRILICIGSLQLLFYILATIINGTFKNDPYLYTNNLFFVVSMTSLGFFMTYILQRLNWKNFLHQKAISESYNKLLEEMKDRKLAEEALSRSEEQYHTTLNSIPDWIYVVDEKFKFVMLNSSLKEEHDRQGFPVNCVGKKLKEIYPLISKTTLEEIDFVFRNGVIVISEQKFNLGDKTIYGEFRKVPIFKDNRVVQVMTILRDRSKAREVEELKLRNAEQKEIMLREIHHRVKNNLAIVISLLSLQLRNNADPELHRIIKDIEMRIRSMALIHEHLYRSENLDRIPLADYLHSLTNIILATFSGHKIKIVTDFVSTDVSLETALPLGLITNELLTNAFKYAFPGNQPGEIQVHLNQLGERQFQLIIQDNGVGLPGDFSFNTQQSLGVFIVRLLVEQLDGKIEVDTKNGSKFTITFQNTTPKKIEYSLSQFP